MWYDFVSADIEPKGSKCVCPCFVNCENVIGYTGRIINKQFY